jgi:hypothetical protein
MQSYRLDSAGKLIDFHASEIGLITTILFYKQWGRIPVNGRPRSEQWWRNRLNDLINAPTVEIAPENLWDGNTAEPAPIPFEIEMGMPDLNYETFFKAWRMMKSRA